MKLSTIKSTQFFKVPIRVDKKSVILMWPDDSQKIWDVVYNTNLFLSNCKGIIVPNKMWTIYRKKINGKHHYLDVRKKIMENENVAKKLRVLATLPAGQIQHSEIKEKSVLTSSKIESSDFYFYDLSMIAEGVQGMLDKGLSEKIVFSVMIEEIAKVYKSIRSSDPDIHIELFVDLKTKSGLFFKFISEFKRYKQMLNKELSENNLFDTYCFASINEYVLPIFEKEKETISIILPNLTRLQNLVETIEVSKEIENTPAIDNLAEPSRIDEKQPESIVTSVVKSLSDPIKFLKHDETIQKNIFSTKITPSLRDEINKRKEPSVLINKTENIEKQPPKITNVSKTLIAKTPIKLKPVIKQNNEISVAIDPKVLSKTLKAFKINNPDVTANVKAALDRYINETGIRPTQDKAEEIVLKAINYTVHGTDIIDPKYTKTPGALIKKLSQLDVYKKPLEFPKPTLEQSIDPSDIIDIKSTTGQHRQEYEFTNLIHENVRKVFETLETQINHPIKIKDFKWEFKDNESDRYINYQVTLQNMTGPNRKEYVVEANVPSTVNEKYFKLSGNSYIFSTQQHMRPITKTDKDEVRILTNYAIVRVGIQNLKFGVTDINDIVEYINQKYPNIITENKDNTITFNDGDKIYTAGNRVYDSTDLNLIIDEETNKVKNEQTGDFLKTNRFEILFDIFINKISKINSADALTRTKKAIPYLTIFLAGTKMPLIIYLWSQKGLLPTLNSFGVDYEISKEKGKRGETVLELSSGEYLYMRPKNLRERMLVNGLFVSKIKKPINDLNSRDEIRDHIIETYGSRANYNVDNMTQNLIDPVTKELLLFENLPTNLPSLITEHVINILFNSKPDSLSDLKIYRSRMSEIVLRLLYKQLCDTFSN